MRVPRNRHDRAHPRPHGLGDMRDERLIRAVMGVVEHDHRPLEQLVAVAGGQPVDRRLDRQGALSSARADDH